MKRQGILILLLILVLILSACGKKDDQEATKPQEPKEIKEEPKKEEPQEKKEEPKEEKQEPQDAVEEIFKHRPVAVMIDNHWDARPQSGFALSKVVYEVLAEGRISRFMMLTDSDEGIIGPIRSARPYFVRFVHEWDGLYCHVGGSKEAIQTIRSQGVVKDMDQFWVGSGAYWRENHREMPHNMYAELAKVYEVAKEKKGYDREPDKDRVFPFRQYTKDHELEGESAQEVAFSYYNTDAISGNNIRFVYNEEKGAYERYINGEIYVDEQTKEPIEVKNLIIEIVEHRPDPDGVHIIVENVGKGKGYYITGGKHVELTWEKKDEFSPTHYYLGDQELIVNPGLTFINVIEETMEVSFK